MSINLVLTNYFSDLNEVQFEPWQSEQSLSSASFWKVQAGSNRWLCKSSPDDPATYKAMRLGHGLQRHLAKKDVAFFPKPLSAVDGTTVQTVDGLLWELLAWLPGASCDVDKATLVVKQRMLRALASIHSGSRDYAGGCIQGSSRVLKDRAQRLSNLRITPYDVGMQVEVTKVADELQKPLLNLRRLLPEVVPVAMRAIDQAMNGTFEIHPILRDTRAEHFLIEEERVVGLVDWGAACWDTALVDVARLLGDLASSSTAEWNTAIDHYAQEKRLSNSNRIACFALHASGTVLAGWRWWTWLAVEHREFGNPALVLARIEKISTRLGNLASGQLKPTL